MLIHKKQPFFDNKYIIAALSNISSYVLILLLVVLTNTNYCYGRCARAPPISEMFPSSPLVARLRITNVEDTDSDVCSDSDFYGPPAVATVLEIFQNNDTDVSIPPVGESIFLYYWTDTGYRMGWPSTLTNPSINGEDEGFLAFLDPMDACMDVNSNDIVMQISQCLWEANIPWVSVNETDKVLLRAEQLGEQGEEQDGEEEEPQKGQQQNVTLTATTTSTTTATDEDSTTATSASTHDTELNNVEATSASATARNLISFCSLCLLLQILLL